MIKTSAIFFAACLGMLLFGIGFITLGSVATSLQAKFSLDSLASGALFSILPIGILAGSIAFGPFCDRFGYKYFLLLSCLCMFAGFQGIASVSSLALLKICIFLFGFGGGSINGATNAVVADISSENKGANLSLLGVFFAIGALGMPFVLASLEKQFSFEVILSAVGYLTLLAGIFFWFTTFPVPKQTQAIPFLKGMALLKDPLLILIGFFLFCQSSFEGIINNWTTMYLSSELSVVPSKALYALSLYVTGMAVMRILIGSVFRSFSSRTILFLSFVLLLSGCLLLKLATFYAMAVVGLVLIGAGLAAGFPVMLGFVGERYTALSGTAFSLVLAMSLIGNMLVNFLMGIIAEAFGIAHLTSVAFMLLFTMLFLSLGILKKINF